MLISQPIVRPVGLTTLIGQGWVLGPPLEPGGGVSPTPTLPQGLEEGFSPKGRSEAREWRLGRHMQPVSPTLGWRLPSSGPRVLAWSSPSASDWGHLAIDADFILISPDGMWESLAFPQPPTPDEKTEALGQFPEALPVSGGLGLEAWFLGCESRPLPGEFRGAEHITLVLFIHSFIYSSSSQVIEHLLCDCRCSREQQ